MPRNLQKKSGINFAETHTKKTETFRQKINITKSCGSIDQMALVYYSVSMSPKIYKKLHFFSGKSFFLISLRQTFNKDNFLAAKKIKEQLTKSFEDDLLMMEGHWTSC